MRTFFKLLVGAAFSCLAAATLFAQPYYTNVVGGITNPPFAGAYTPNQNLNTTPPQVFSGWVLIQVPSNETNVPALRIVAPSSATNLLEIWNGGTNVFYIPNNLAALAVELAFTNIQAVLPIVNGGTGTNSLAYVSWPTNNATIAWILGKQTVVGVQTNLAGVQMNSTLTVGGLLTSAATAAIPTNTASFSEVTNDFIAGGMYLLRNQRAKIICPGHRRWNYNACT